VIASSSHVVQVLRSSLAVAAIVSLALPAAAQGSPTDAAAAEALFRAGRELMDQGKYTRACDQFKASYELERAGGTLLNLALCHEKEGRIATAWLEYQQAEADAIRDQRDDREVFAQEHMAALRPRLPKILLTVDAPVPNMAVKVGDFEVPPASFGLELPFDPGTYEVVVEAPGFRTWRRSFVMKERSLLPISVPPLQPLPKRAESEWQPAPRPEPVHTERRPPLAADNTSSAPAALRTSAWVGGAAGVALVGVGSYFGVRALQKKSEADDVCGPDTCEGERGSALDAEAHDAAIKANLLIGGGVILTGLATFTLLWTAEDQSSQESVAVETNASDGVLATYRMRW